MIKPIVPIASPLVNYLTYIQACCGINWKLDDTPPAQDLLSDEDRNLMQSCVTDLSFGLGLGGSLAGMFYFLPAYIFRENDAGFTDYFTCLAQCHEAGSLSPLIEEYGHHIRQIEEFTGGALEEMPFGNKMLYKIKQLSAVYKANYHKYLQYHWEEDRVIAEKTCDYIHEIFAGNDIVGRWEDLTGYGVVRSVSTADSYISAGWNCGKFTALWREYLPRSYQIPPQGVFYLFCITRSWYTHPKTSHFGSSTADRRGF